jgi:hypothetical protein
MIGKLGSRHLNSGSLTSSFHRIGVPGSSFTLAPLSVLVLVSQVVHLLPDIPEQQDDAEQAFFRYALSDVSFTICTADST